MPIKNPAKTTTEDVKQFLSAACMGDLDTLKEMLLNGTVHVNDCLDDESFQNLPAGTTVLMAAAFNAQKPIVDFLLGNDYEFSHRYVPRYTDGNILNNNIEFYEDYTRAKLALTEITLTNVDNNGDNAFSLALKSQGKRKKRDEIAAALLDAAGTIEFRKLSQDTKTPEEIHDFFYPVAKKNEVSSSMPGSDDEEFSTEYDGELFDYELDTVTVSFTTGNVLAALTQEEQRKFAMTNIQDPLVLVAEQELHLTAIRLLKLGLPYSAAAKVTKSNDVNYINTLFKKRTISEQEPMDHTTREDRVNTEQISSKIGTREEMGDELYKRNLDQYYKALHYADLEVQDNLFHLMQILLQKNDLSTPDKNGRQLRITSADVLLVQRVIHELMPPVMFARKFADSSLMFGAENADDATIILLANMGVSVLEPNANGITPICFMAEKGNMAAVRSLWSRGALLSDIATVAAFDSRRFVFFYNEPTAGKAIFYGTALQFAALTQDAPFLEALLSANLVSPLAGKEQIQQIAKILRKPTFADMRVALENEGLPVQNRNMFGIFCFSSCFCITDQRKRDTVSPVLANTDSRTASPDHNENLAGMLITPSVTISSSRKRPV